MIILDGWVCWHNNQGGLERVIPFEEYNQRAKDIASIMGAVSPEDQEIRIKQVKQDIDRRRREWMKREQ